MSLKDKIMDKITEKIVDKLDQDYIDYAMLSFTRPEGLSEREIDLIVRGTKTTKKGRAYLDMLFQGQIHIQNSLPEYWTELLKQGTDKQSRLKGMIDEFGTEISENYIQFVTERMEHFNDYEYDQCYGYPICLNCGTFIGKWFDHCPNPECGIPLVEGRPVWDIDDDYEDEDVDNTNEAPIYKFCATCGAKLEADTSFCSTCGSKQ